MREKLNSYHIAILVYMTQSGIIVFSLPRLIAENFGTNGWLWIISCSLAASLNILLIQLVYRFGNGSSIFDILEYRIPLAALSPVYVVLGLLWALLGCMVGKQYVIIYQMIAFPTTDPTIFKFAFDVLAFFLLTKPIYSITKATTVFFYLTVWIVIILLFHFHEFSLVRMTPFIGHEAIGGFDSWLEIYTAYLGYEVCLFLFPHVPKKTRFFTAVYIGNLLLTLIYLAVCIVAFGFFSFDQLKNLTYPLLDIIAYLQLPFVERLENFLFTLFLIKVLITTVIYYWIAKITLSRVFRKVQDSSLSLSIIVVTFGVSLLTQEIGQVETVIRFLAYTQIAIVFSLPLLLIAIIAMNQHAGRREP